MSISELQDEYKVVLSLELAQQMISKLSKLEDRELAQKVLSCCWDWVENKNIEASNIYELLDDEFNGLVLVQQMCELEDDVDVWNCIIYAVAYTSRIAYEYEGAKYFPQAIEGRSINLFNDFMDMFNIACGNSEVMDKIISHIEKESEIDIKAIKKIINGKTF